MILKTSSVELDITYLCNLACNGCTRRCDLLPGVADAAIIENIKNQFNETIAMKHVFNAVFLMGGEPTLYENLPELLDFLNEYRKKTRKTRIILVSNCHGSKVNQVLQSLPPWVETRYAPKDGSTKHSTRPSQYWSMNVAPVDFPFFEGEDYGSGCKQQRRCGVQLATNNKWYACPMAGGIDRVFNLDAGISAFSELVKPEVFTEQFRKLCGLCGRFRLKYAHYHLDERNRIEARFNDPSQYQPFINSLQEWPLYSGRLLSKSWKEAMGKIGMQKMSQEDSLSPDEKE